MERKHGHVAHAGQFQSSVLLSRLPFSPFLKWISCSLTVLGPMFDLGDIWKGPMIFSPCE